MIARPTHRGGFTLIELITYVVLLSFAVYASANTIARMVRIQEHAGKAQDRFAQFDTLTGRLRQDALLAGKITVLDPQTLEMQQGDQRSIVWSIREQHVLRRERAGDAVTETRPITQPAAFAFAQSGPGVAVTAASMTRPGDRPQSEPIRSNARVTIYPSRALMEPTP